MIEASHRAAARRLPRLLGAAVGLSLFAAALAGCGRDAGRPEAALGGAKGDWPAYGGGYAETHHAELDKVTPANISRLGLAFAADLGNDAHGATTPLAVDGVVYLTVGQSVVHAVDVRTGRTRWVHDPHVAERAGRKLRYAFGPRGLAYSRGRVFVGAMDGRLIALDADTGREVWSVQTIDPEDDRYITGAPRVCGDLVVIGHGGADVAPIRGYVTAYDVRTGAQRWRFHTVPGDPAKGFENAAMAAAAKTWSGEWWKLGGGGTVWNAMTYDPEQKLVFLGTGNGAPHNQRIRSPGGGDNLYLSSIVALDADTGAYRWHHQINPGETWDYNAAMDMALATLLIDGKPRKVLMQAPKDGFFYVLDRVTGKLISAGKFAENVTWAHRVDIATGRPVETASARDPAAIVWPGSMGAHNWAPMAFSPTTGLAYIPTLEMPGAYDDRSIDKAQWKHEPGRYNTGYSMSADAVPANAGTSYLQAYDPVRQRRVWKVPLPGAWPGGVLSTAGGLVFIGRPDGRFDAYDARRGRLLWSYDAGLGISGAPISFAVDGKQYVAVVAGWGGGGAGFLGRLSAFGWQPRLKRNHLLVFTLGGKAPPPPQAARRTAEPIDDPTFVLDPVSAARGGDLFAPRCGPCHGAGVVAAGYAPDLRASPMTLDRDAFRSVVRDGAMLSRAMPAYPELGDAELESIRHFIRARARADLRAVAKGPRS